MPDTASCKEVVRALDVELPFLAAEAAFQLDNLLVGNKCDFEKIRTLAEMVANSLQVEGQLDSASVALMFDAMTESAGTEPITHWVLVKKAIEDVKPTGKVMKSEEEALLVRTRDFFVALSQRSAACSGAMYDPQTTQPYRS